MSIEGHPRPYIEAASSPVVMRPLCVEDIPSLEPIILHWVRLSKDTSETPEAKTKRYLADMEASTHPDTDKYYTVAQTANGEVIGVGGIKSPSAELLPYTRTEHPAEIVNMYVHPDHRMGKGVGTQIIDNLTMYAASKGHTELVVISGPTFRDTGWEFYRRLEEKRGYESLGMAQDYYGEGIHAPVWRKPLEA